MDSTNNPIEFTDAHSWFKFIWHIDCDILVRDGRVYECMTLLKEKEIHNIEGKLIAVYTNYKKK